MAVSHMSMFRLRAASAVAAVAVAASGLVIAPSATASEVSPATVAVASVSAPTVVPAWTKKEKRYAAFVKSEAYGLSDIPSRYIINAGKEVCANLKNGIDPLEIIESYMDSDFTEDEIIAVIGGAVVYLCPGQAYKFE